MTLTPQDILHFWFEEAEPKDWFAVNADFDDRIRERFLPLYNHLSPQDDLTSHPWLSEADSALALVIILDQFPRNIWRDEPGAFAYDNLALDVARLAIKAGHDQTLAPDRRSFFYMPFMHAEDLETQNEGVQLCEVRLGEDDATTRHAKAHRDVIERFGRFPHRNGILEREPSLEEISYLAEGGYAPGAKSPAKST